LYEIFHFCDIVNLAVSDTEIENKEEHTNGTKLNQLMGILGMEVLLSRWETLDTTDNSNITIVLGSNNETP
jgi:hypothetical protein